MEKWSGVCVSNCFRNAPRGERSCSDSEGKERGGEAFGTKGKGGRGRNEWGAKEAIDRGRGRERGDTLAKTLLD